MKAAECFCSMFERKCGMSVRQWDETKYMTIHMNERFTRFAIDSENLAINKRRKNRMPFWSVGGGKCEVIASA